MNYKVVDMIQHLLKDPKMSPNDIINDRNIRKELDNLFENKDGITKGELKYFTDDKTVQNVITLYLYEKGIALLDNDSYVTGIGREDLDTLALYFKDINKFPLLTDEEEVELFIKLNTTKNPIEYKKIKDQIINANLRLVIKYATIKQNRGLPIEDLIQEGNIGLILAVDKFDVTKGYKFSTYATQWIKNKINNGIADKSRNIKYPMHIHNNLQKLNKLRVDYYKETGTYLSIKDEKTKEEYAEKINVNKENLEILLTLPTTISLETPVNMYNNPKINEVKDFIPDESNDSEKEVMDKKEQEEIRELLTGESLTEREKIVLIKRHGLCDSEPVTLRDLGEELGLSCERIRQIQKKGENKVKVLAIKKGLHI